MRRNRDLIDVVIDWLHVALVVLLLVVFGLGVLTGRCG